MRTYTLPYVRKKIAQNANKRFVYLKTMIFYEDFMFEWKKLVITKTKIMRNFYKNRPRFNFLVLPYT